jgi:ribonuclease HII
MMLDYESQFPGYGFARHKGYCTADHFAALAELGPSPIHRRSFMPVRDAAQRKLF